MHMWAKIVTCHISNKPPSHQPLQLSPAVHYKGTLDGEKQDTGPRWLKCIWKKWFHLHIPVNRKTLNSFNQRIPFFSLINSNPWCSTIWCLPVCVDKIPIQSGSYLTSLEWSIRASLVVQSVKSLSAMQETCIQSLGWEEPLEKEMTIHSTILSWRIPWTEEPRGLQSMGSQRVRHNWVTNFHFHFPQSYLETVSQA